MPRFPQKDTFNDYSKRIGKRKRAGFDGSKVVPAAGIGAGKLAKAKERAVPRKKNEKKKAKRGMVLLRRETRSSRKRRWEDEDAGESSRKRQRVEGDGDGDGDAEESFEALPDEWLDGEEIEGGTL